MSSLANPQGALCRHASDLAPTGCRCIKGAGPTATDLTPTGRHRCACFYRTPEGWGCRPLRVAEGWDQGDLSDRVKKGAGWPPAPSQVLPMYARSLEMENFKCFGHASMQLQFPGREKIDGLEIDNVNLILGDNGGGKSSVLRALAIAMLAPVLPGAGFVATRLVRRLRENLPPIQVANLMVGGWRPPGQLIGTGRKQAFKLPARIRQSSTGPDRLLELEWDTPIYAALEDDMSSALFVAGYGATRYVESGNFSVSSALKSRSVRYQRVAGLFEDNVTLRPMQSWLPAIQRRRQASCDDVINLMNRVLPANIRFFGQFNEFDDQYEFEFNGLRTPFGSLSDGYKAFVGWVGDLLGHLAEVAGDKPISSIPGLVLVDEIDLHLHPEWQRTVVPTLARALPKLQFVLTSHSPLVTASLRKENVFVTDTAEDGTALVEQLDENVHGRSMQQLLLSSYFGLTSTRPEAFQDEARKLYRRAAAGDPDAALEYLDSLSGSNGSNRE